MYAAIKYTLKFMLSERACRVAWPPLEKAGRAIVPNLAKGISYRDSGDTGPGSPESGYANENALERGPALPDQVTLQGRLFFRLLRRDSSEGW
jgi:hypothetical protein